MMTNSQMNVKFRENQLPFRPLFMEKLSVFTKTKGFLCYEELTYICRYGMSYEIVYFNQKEYMNDLSRGDEPLNHLWKGTRRLQNR